MEVTDLPEGYSPSARALFPAEVRSIEDAAAALFGERLAFHAGASDIPETAVRIFVIRADAADIENGEALSTGNVSVLVSPAVASTDDLKDVALAISAELSAREPDVEVHLSIQALDQILTVGTPPGTSEDAIERLTQIASRVIDEEADRIAAERPESVNVDVPWSTQVLRFATVVVTNSLDAPIG